MQTDDLDAIDAILDDLRTRFDETPQWEFCDGFLAALVVSRRAIAPAEYLPVLLDVPAPGQPELPEAACAGSFQGPEQAQRFMELWMRRWQEVSQALAADVQDLHDERAYHPDVMDVRAALASLPPEERRAVADEHIPSLGQVWAVGFMFAVESWPLEWAPPRDKEACTVLDAALQAMVELTEDDTEPATVSPTDDSGPPTVSTKRMELFGAAIWAVYDLYALWRDIGPRVETVHRAPQPGRNEPCHCGSGKKYKKCHGA